MNTLEYIKKHTVVVADTGDFNSMKAYRPTDATTNPSLLFAASKIPDYDHILADAVQYAFTNTTCPQKRLSLATDFAVVKFGVEILKIVPGRVSTEVDARLAFDENAQFNKACEFIKLYETFGISKERVLIKLPSTWEGIQAGKRLEAEMGIHCNLTLLFCLPQAIACAEASVTLISPFVGRIYDYYVAKSKATGAEPVAYTKLTDPGVTSVTEIFNYYKQFGYKTQVMGASFRNVNQILGLVGCDLLTISPNLLQQLTDMNETPDVHLDAGKPCSQLEKMSLMEADFRLKLAMNEVACDKLYDGIRKFVADAIKLENMIAERIAAHQT